MSILYKINKYSGTYLFNEPNTLTYSLFNFLYNKFIINLDGADEEIKYFHENGYFKPKINFKNEVYQLNNVIEIDNVDNNQSQFKFSLNSNSIQIIKKLLNSKKFLDLKDKLEKYFNSHMYLIDVKVARNFPIEKKIEHKMNLYSNNYHVDYYTVNFFKMFINLHDVDDTQGPMNFYSKKNSKKFIKFNNYKDRSNYNLRNEKELGLVKNTGSSGDLLICSTPQCLHRATSPNIGKHRDMLFLSFAVTSEKNEQNGSLYSFEKKNFDDIWNCTSVLSKKLCKPKSFREQIKNFRKFFKNKII
tara:strand:+ start:1122 stop:2027 length:906 start_codon:yes stop_codon:yes gene_type:complete